MSTNFLCCPSTTAIPIPNSCINSGESMGLRTAESISPWAKLTKNQLTLTGLGTLPNCCLYEACKGT